MSLRQEISEAQVTALKGHDEKSLSILRIIWSAIKNVEIDKHHELNDEEVETVVSQLNKQLLDALKDYQTAGREDLVLKANFEISLLKKYLPEQLTDEQLMVIAKKIVVDSGLKGAGEVGKVMGMVMKEVKGKADGNRVREIVIQLLSE